MKCIIPGTNVKILARAIHALAKVGDEMYVQPQEKSLSFRTVNMANSAYIDITFFENYFAYYNFGNLEEDDALKCKISMRSAMSVFKFPMAIDKHVETCHINLEPNATTLLLVLKYKNNIIKTHLLPIIDCEKLQAAYAKDSVPNLLISQARVLLDALQNFQTWLIEITLEITQHKVLLRNYVNEVSNMSNHTRTQLVIGIGEFDQYIVGNETSITFCVKELRAILHLAESLSMPINLHFETAGKPIVFVLKNPIFEANLVLSTLNPEADLSQLSNKSNAEMSNNKTIAKNPGKSKRGRKPSSSIKNSKNTSFDFVHPALAEVSPLPHKKVNPQIENSMDIESDILSHENFMSDRDDRKRENINTPSSVASSVQKKLTENKKLANTVFSTVTKRKVSSGNSSKTNNDGNESDDTICRSPSPPSKRARCIFKKCFQATFDPITIPGHETILAQDTDDEDTE